MQTISLCTLHEINHDVLDFFCGGVNLEKKECDVYDRQFEQSVATSCLEFSCSCPAGAEVNPPAARQCDPGLTPRPGIDT